MLCGKLISIIFASSAYAQNGKLVIGLNGDIPWRGKVPSDMDRFVDLTKGSSIAMGSKTFWSIPEKFRPFDKNLPLEESRQTIVLTTNKFLKIDNPRVVIVHSLEEAAQKAKSRILWIAGGAMTYAMALPFADYIHQTLISERFLGDTFFPKYDPDEWIDIYSIFYKTGGIDNPKDKFDTFYKIFERRYLEKTIV